MKPSHSSSSARASFGEGLRMAIWFGALAGLLEGLTAWGLPVLGLSGRARACGVGLGSLWIPTTVDAILFLVLGVALVTLLRLLPRLPWVNITAGTFAALLFYSVLSTAGRFNEYGTMLLSVGLGVATARWVGGRPEQRVAALNRLLAPSLVLIAVVCLAPWLAQAVSEKMRAARLPAASPGTPNVLVIVMDTVRADRLGAYGYARPTTPFLDEFARRSVLFENTVANSSWTLPAHVSMFTGRLPAEHQAEFRGECYDGRFPTLAKVLGARGFASAAIVANREMAGCATGVSYDFLHHEESPPLGARLMESFFLLKLRVPAILRRLGVEHGREWMNAQEVNRRFLRWMDSRPDRPFFAFLNYMEAHDPYEPPFEYARRFSTNVSPVPMGKWLYLRNNENASDPETLQHASDFYDASLAYLDEQLRLLFDALRRRGLEDNTLVIITSDHGESFGEHGLLGHQISLYRDQIHVPLLIRFPGQTPEGVRVPQLVGLNQVAATAAELAGLNEHPFPGQSLRRFWNPDPPAQPVVSQLSGGHWPHVPRHWPIYKGRLRSVVSAPWHLVELGDGSRELFDWSQDPNEDHNLADDPQFKDIVAALLAQLPAAPNR